MKEEMSMETLKWDGVTDADDILKALLFFVYDRDLELCNTTSYGDYGKYLCKHYKCLGAGNGGTYVIQGGAKYVDVTLIKKNIRYSLTWNKAAKLIHQHFNNRRKKENGK